MSRHSACAQLIGLAGLLTFAGALSGASQRVTASQDVPPKKTVWDGVYAASQASRGKLVYQEICAECHDTGEAPVLFGAGFMRRWFQESLDDVFTKMRTTMPANGPGRLPTGTYLDVLSFVLEESGFLHRADDGGFGLHRIRIVSPREFTITEARISDTSCPWNGRLPQRSS